MIFAIFFVAHANKIVEVEIIFFADSSTILISTFCFVHSSSWFANLAVCMHSLQKIALSSCLSHSLHLHTSRVVVWWHVNDHRILEDKMRLQASSCKLASLALCNPVCSQDCSDLYACALLQSCCFSNSCWLHANKILMIFEIIFFVAFVKQDLEIEIICSKFFDFGNEWAL